MELDVSPDGGQTFYPVAGTAGGALDVNVTNVLSGAALPTGQAVMASSVPVAIASNQSAVPVSITAALTPFYPSSGSIVAGAIKASAGKLYGLSASNGVAGVTWLCFYNQTSAPTLGSDTPVFALPIPAGVGSVLTIPPGVFALSAFTVGIAWAAATTAAGASAPATAPSGMAFYL